MSLLDYLNPYTKYELIEENTEIEAETVQVAVRSTPSDPMDFDVVPSGRKIEIKYAIYRAYSKFTGLPKFKRIITSKNYLDKTV